MLSNTAQIPSNTPGADLSRAWPTLLAKIRQRINGQSYNTWFRPIHCLGSTGQQLQLGVPTTFHKDWLGDHYLDFMAEQLAELGFAGVSFAVEVVPELVDAVHTEESLAAVEAPAAALMAEAVPARTTAAVGRPLNPRYTFANFVVGPSNQFCHAASQAVGERPAVAYNPLFIYGGTGLGKTHLLHAIGMSIQARNPAARIIYVSSEEFVNDLIDSMRHEKMGSFRARYRAQCDVLLIDDIQFISGKDRTQEEFFHTFNHLYESHKQIVLTSDKFPHEITGLEERLRTRFQSGLIADIQPPEMETRVAILKNKAEKEGIVLHDDVALFLAAHIKSNVRELEGALIRLQAYASLTYLPLTLELAKERLKGLVTTENKAINAEQVQKLVANYFSLKSSDLRGQNRQRAVSLPRQIAMYLCRKHCGLSFPEIGERFGGKDHTTVMSAVRKIENSLPRDPTIKKAVDALETALAA